MKLVAKITALANISLMYLLASTLLASCQLHSDADPLLVNPPPTPTPIKIKAAEPAPPPPQPVAKFPETDSDVAAVTFEDMSPTKNDEDFNDFLTDFKIYEKINAQNQITNIVIDFYPRAVGASYDHAFLMVLNGVKDSPTDVKHPKLDALIHGPADVELTYFAETGNQPVQGPTKVSADHDVMIFPSTHALFGDANSKLTFNTNQAKPYVAAKTRARLSITLLDPTQNPADPQNPINISKFRMVLHVKNTNRDIDIVDVDPANFDKNKQDNLYYPFGFIIPDNWRWPNEGVPIAQAYPSFQAYNEYLRNHLTDPTITAPSQVANWFNAPPVANNVYSDQGRDIPAPELLDNPW